MLYIGSLKILEVTPVVNKKLRVLFPAVNMYEYVIYRGDNSNNDVANKCVVNMFIEHAP